MLLPIVPLRGRKVYSDRDSRHNGRRNIVEIPLYFIAGIRHCRLPLPMSQVAT